MDSRDVFENEASEGVARPGSWELRLPLRKKDANALIRRPSELRRRKLEPCLDVVVSTVSTGCNDPLLVGSY